MEARGDMSLIRLPLRSREVRLVREARGDMSLIWFCQRLSEVKLEQYSIPERSAMLRPEMSSSVSPASSAAVIACPGGLPRASLMATPRFSSGKVTVPGSVVVGRVVVVGSGVVVVVVGGVVVSGGQPQAASTAPISITIARSGISPASLFAGLGRGAFNISAILILPSSGCNEGAACLAWPAHWTSTTDRSYRNW